MGKICYDCDCDPDPDPDRKDALHRVLVKTEWERNHLKQHWQKSPRVKSCDCAEKLPATSGAERTRCPNWIKRHV